MTDTVRTPASRPRGLLLGLAAGVMSGLFGIGGGAVLVPGLVLVMGVTQHVAHATSLAAILITAPAAALAFGFDGSIAYVPAAAIALGSIAGAFLGAGWMHRVSDVRLRQAFALLLVIVAVRLAFPTEIVGGGGQASIDVLRMAGFVLLGLATGVLSSLMGVGGGIIMVPALVLLFSFSQHTAEGTSLLVIVPTALVGATRHARRGYTDWRLGLLVGIGGVLGGLAGAQLALALPAEWLSRLFAVLVAVMAMQLLLRNRSRSDEVAAGDEIDDEVTEH